VAGRWSSNKWKGCPTVRNVKTGTRPGPVVKTPPSKQAMRLEEGMDLAHRQRNPLFGLFPREDAHFGIWARASRTPWRRRKGARGRRPAGPRNRVLATTHEIACQGEDEVGIGFEHPVTNWSAVWIVISGRLQVSAGPQGRPKMRRVLTVAHLRTPTHGLRQHSRGNTIGGALQRLQMKGPPCRSPSP